MSDAMKWSIRDRMDPSCLTAGWPSIPDGKEVHHV
jgi:hypothetical protein